MEYETLAVLSVEAKLPLLEKMLDRRVERASLDLTSPTLPLLEKVRKYGEYKRLVANLAVMAHRITCALGADASFLQGALRSGNAPALTSRHGQSAARAARAVLVRLGVASLNPYRALPLFAAECKRIKRLLSSPPPSSCHIPTPSPYASV